MNPFPNAGGTVADIAEIRPNPIAEMIGAAIFTTGDPGIVLVCANWRQGHRKILGGTSPDGPDAIGIPVQHVLQ